MLTRLHVKGYKSLIDVEVALKPLTLCGGTSMREVALFGRRPAGSHAPVGDAAR